MPSSERFSGDVLMFTREGERVVVDRQLEALGNLVLVANLAHTQADLVAPAELGCVYPVLDLCEITLGGAQQLFVFVGALAIMPRSPAVTSCSTPKSSHNRLIWGMRVLLSVTLPSETDTATGQPRASVSKP